MTLVSPCLVSPGVSTVLAPLVVLNVVGIFSHETAVGPEKNSLLRAISSLLPDVHCTSVVHPHPSFTPCLLIAVTSRSTERISQRFTTVSVVSRTVPASLWISFTVDSGIPANEAFCLCFSYVYPPLPSHRRTPSLPRCAMQYTDALSEVVADETRDEMQFVYGIS